jgi:hypothetical protein
MNIVAKLTPCASFAINLRGRVKFPIGGKASTGQARDLDGLLEIERLTVIAR